jgi:hypothetical protein
MTKDEINEKITPADRKVAAQAIGKSISLVNQVLSGERNNPFVLPACEDAILMREGILPSLKAKYQTKEPNKA